MSDLDYDAQDRTPHTHGGTDAPECAPYGIKCRPAAQSTTAPTSVTAREITEAILRELPMSDDRTGHIADCGFTHEGPPCDCSSLPSRIQARLLDLAQRAEAAEAAVERLTEALDPEEFECGRLGLPCTSVAPADRWCRACRLRAALDPKADR